MPLGRFHAYLSQLDALRAADLSDRITAAMMPGATEKARAEVQSEIEQATDPRSFDEKVEAGWAKLRMLFGRGRQGSD